MGGACDTYHYYGYYVWQPWGAVPPHNFVIFAQRCTAGGKVPQGSSDFIISYADNFSGVSYGTDGWGGFNVWMWGPTWDDRRF